MKLRRVINRALRFANLKLVTSKKLSRQKRRAAALAESARRLRAEVDRMTIESLYQINRIKSLREQLSEATNATELRQLPSEPPDLHVVDDEDGPAPKSALIK